MQDDIIEIEEEERPSLIKKILIIIMGIFLLLLIISYLVPPPGVFEMLAGFIESSKLKVEENKGLLVSVIPDVRLAFDNESLATLNVLYDENIGREFKVCLKGTKINNTYYIEETIQPKTFLQEFNRVVAEPCTAEYLVSLHTHPFKQCLPSKVDLENFKRFKERNPDALMAIMCDKDRFNVYS